MTTQYHGLDLRPGQYQWVICDRCRGEGKHDHPAFSNGITQDEWEQWDYEERDDYFSGKYDVPCTDCGGSGKVAVPVKGQLEFWQLRILAAERRLQRDLSFVDAIQRQERRAEAYVAGASDWYSY